MAEDLHLSGESFRLAQLWCEKKGPGWTVSGQLGAGGTAPVFEVASAEGPRALKIYDAAFSAGERGEVEQKRIEQQLALKGHDCPHLVQVYEGGTFEGRLYLLMSRAPGRELKTRLGDVPRPKIRNIVGQVAQAAMFLRGTDLCHRDIKAANIFISDDYRHATLLDISVIRNIRDPIGAGTDHDGQLPVLATTRYSPPEYLFRLLDPGPELWHALNIYQLGGLLHDLIMREPLFEAEYLRSAENRYRFAWIVATVIPKVEAEDVDQDLVFIARRALDKDWKRRSDLKLEEFLADSKTQQAHALQCLGFAGARGVVSQSDDVGVRLQRVRDVSNGLDETLRRFLMKGGITAKHEVKPGTTDTSKLLTFRWEAASAETESDHQLVEFEVTVQLLARLEGYRFGMSAKLSTQVGEAKRAVAIELPDLQDESGVESDLAKQAECAFAKLAVEITGAGVGTGGM